MSGLELRHSWCVPAPHPVFAGHFPNMPIVPGVLLLDTVIQVLGAAGWADPIHLRSVKFLSPARPGDTLDMVCTPAANGTIHFEILAGTRKVAVGDLTASVARQPA